MKRTIVLLALFIATLSVHSQESNTDKELFKHEFGIEATGFVKYILDFNNENMYSNYTPTYFLTYRRHFDNGNLRMQLGGSFDFSDDSTDDIYEENNQKLDRTTYFVKAKIGWEKEKDLGGRWQVFYGIDHWQRYYYHKSTYEREYYNQITKQKARNKYFALSPLLGFRFNLSKRISISTETSLSFIYSVAKSEIYYDSSGTIEESNPESKSFSTSYNDPFQIFFTFMI